METTTHTPSGMDAPESDPAAALHLLRARLGIDFTTPYSDPADKRREIAVLAVDLGRRLLDVQRRLAAELDREQVVLGRLAEACRTDNGDMGADRPDLRETAGTVSLHARAAELDRTLRLVAVAYKQAWWSDAQPVEAAGA